MRTRLVGLQLVIVVALLGVSSAARQRSTAVETFDLMPLYWQFWAKAQSLPEAEQIPKLFREMIVERLPEVSTTPRS